MIVLGENNISLKQLHQDKHSTSSNKKKMAAEKMKDLVKKDVSSET